jgi:hypothetical protein
VTWVKVLLGMGYVGDCVTWVKVLLVRDKWVILWGG